jgi:hypothetical protein
VAVAAPVVPGFEELQLIGRGGFSSVYRAVQSDLGRPVALKVLDVGVEEESARRRFERECRVIGVLNGVKGIVSVHHSTYTADGRPCIVMEHMGRGSLEDYVRRCGPLAVDESLELGVVIGGALAAAHERGVMHRDIKPGNVLISDDGDVALTDFGISVVDDVATHSKTAASLSPPHAPPERFRGAPIDEQLADVYSFGSTVYFALAGRPPFGTAEQGGISGLMSRVAEEPPPPIERDDLPPGVEDLLARMLAKEPEGRIATAAEVRDAFRGLRDGPAAGRRGAGPAAGTIRPDGRPTGPPPAMWMTTPDPDQGRRIVIPPPPTVGPAPTSTGPLPDVSADGVAGDDDLVELAPDAAEVGYSPGAWPTGLDYATAVQDPSQIGDEHIRAAEVVRDMLGMPMSASGQCAIVFQLAGDTGPLAVRCFTRPPEHGAVRYRALARHLERRSCERLVPARWVDDAIVVNDLPWPAVAMPWVPGSPLNVAVEDLLRDPDRLTLLAARWLDVLDDLRAARIAHGDLQNGNVLVDEDLSIRLVDLDGVWIPSLDGRVPGEAGHPDFQHPRRSAEDWGPDVDTFAGFLIHVSLLALAADPSLWAYHAGENLVLGAADLRAPGATPAWGALVRSPDAHVRRLVGVLEEMCRAASPPVGDVRGLLDARPLFAPAGPSVADEPRPEPHRQAPTGDETVRRSREELEATAAAVRADLAAAAVAAGTSTADSPPVDAGTPEHGAAPVGDATGGAAAVDAATAAGAEPQFVAGVVPPPFVPRTPEVADDGAWWRGAPPPISTGEPAGSNGSTAQGASSSSRPGTGPVPWTAPGARSPSAPPVSTPPARTPWYQLGRGALGGAVAGLVAGALVGLLTVPVEDSLGRSFADWIPGTEPLVLPALALGAAGGLLTAVAAGHLRRASLVLRNGVVGLVLCLAAVLVPMLLCGVALGGDDPGVLPLAFAWAAMGGAVGLTVGALRSGATGLLGLVGGLVGGFAGGLLAEAVAAGDWNSPTVGTAVGLTAGTAVVGVAVAVSGQVRRRVWVEITAGPLAGRAVVLAGRAVVLDGDAVVVGSGTRCQVVLPPEDDLLPEHVTIRFGRKGALLDAHGPTWLNGKRVGGLADLEDGDEVRVVSTTLVFRRRSGT